ncbi:cytochrome P450 81Q32-like [Cornus florida]|uniref:cytochrome P450 81Q32-like n=1 Tax=Cornus florida TaxID=4283 RepID=UPI0028A15FED|nr:cytochrome P450 81Q32-like [Cornus florida]
MLQIHWYVLAIIVFLLVIFKPFFIQKQEIYKSLPPSPPSLPIIGHLHLLKQPVHRTLQSLSQKYGEILLLRCGARNILLVTSPAAVEECFTKNDIVFANRPRLLAGKHFTYNYKTVIVAPYGDLWRNLRRVMTLEVLSPARLAPSSNIRQDQVRSLVSQLMQSYASGARKVELKSKFTDLSFNVMTMIIAGKRYFGDDFEDVEEAKQFRDVIRGTLDLSGVSNIGDFLPFLEWIDFQGYEKKMRGLMIKMDKFLQKLVEEHRQVLLIGNKESDSDGSAKKTVVDNLLMMQEKDPEFYTDEIIKGIMLVFLIAGSETSSSTMEWAMALLLNHPDVLKKARAEIDANVGLGCMLDEQNLPKLNYLHNIINEALRLYPPVPLLLPHEASNDCKVHGYDVPHGTMLMINAWAIQRDPELWVEPTRFIPERFEGWNGEGYKLLPFGGGRRGCPGVAMANRVIGLALGALIQSFEWERVGGEEIDMVEGLGLTMPKVKPLEAIYRPRIVITEHPL